MCHGFVPANTSADTDTCVRLFISWAVARNGKFPSQKVPEGVLLTDDHPLLAKWLCRFATEV